MYMDPNWFYSSLAQSTAAIVGVLAAVLVPRLLQQLSDVRNAKIELIRDFLALRSNVQDTLQATSGYLGYLVESLPKLRVAYEGADASHFNIRRIDSFFDPTMGREDR